MDPCPETGGHLKTASTALAVDWTDMETFSRPPPKGTSDCADPEASWGHRKDNRLHRDDELFYGYYLSAAIMMPGEHGPPVPEYARRITTAWDRRQEDNARRAAAGLPPRTRRRRPEPAKPSPPSPQHRRNPQPAPSTTTNTPARQHWHAREQAPRTHSNQQGTQRTGTEVHRCTASAPGMSDPDVKITQGQT